MPWSHWGKINGVCFVRYCEFVYFKMLVMAFKKKGMSVLHQETGVSEVATGAQYYICTWQLKWLMHPYNIYVHRPSSMGSF